MKKKKSWKTTALGILTGIGMLVPNIIAVIDDDPETMLDWKTCLAALGAMGIGFFARDNNVSSEDAGAK